MRYAKLQSEELPGAEEPKEKVDPDWQDVLVTHAEEHRVETVRKRHLVVVSPDAKLLKRIDIDEADVDPRLVVVDVVDLLLVIDDLVLVDLEVDLVDFVSLGLVLQVLQSFLLHVDHALGAQLEVPVRV